MFSFCQERAVVFVVRSSLICTCVQRGLEGRGEFLWDWLHFATSNRRVRMVTVVSEWWCLCEKYLFKTSFHSISTTESLVAEAANSLAFWRSVGGSAGPMTIYFHFLQPVILPESWSCLQPNPATPCQSTSIGSAALSQQIWITWQHKASQIPDCWCKTEHLWSFQ